MKCFEDAPIIKEIAGDIPQQTLPVLCLMLAVLYESEPIPDGSDRERMSFWKTLWDAGHFDDNVYDYLDHFHDRFYLIDDKHPFYQVAGLEYTKKEPSDISEIIADVPKPGKRRFTTRIQNDGDGITLDEAARWLIFHQAYDLAGLKTPVKGSSHVVRGKVSPHGTGILGKQGCVYLEGNSLFQTLMLGFDLDACMDGVMSGDLKALAPWERDCTDPDMRIALASEPVSVVAALTWQSRRVRLVPNDDCTRIIGIISCYGDIPWFADRNDVETMTAWHPSKDMQKQLGTSYVPLTPSRHSNGRMIWQGLSSIISIDPSGGDLRPGVVRWFDRLQYYGILSPAEYPVISIHAQGMVYGTQSACYDDSIDDRCEISSVLARHDLQFCDQAIDVIQHADKAVGQVMNFVSTLCRVRGSNTDIAKRSAAHVRENAYLRLDGVCRQRLAGFPTELDDVPAYIDNWYAQIERVLRSVTDEYAHITKISWFEERNGETAGQAVRRLNDDLYKTLRHTPGKSDEHDDSKSTKRS